MADVKVGDWYFVATCPHCNKPTPVMPDPSRGKVKMAGPGLIQATCGFCKKPFQVSATDLQSREAARVQ